MEAFDHTIDVWIKELEHYNLTQLCTRPSPKTWSVGQVYMHLIEDTTYYQHQIKICLSNDENAAEAASPSAKTLFGNDGFPNEMLEEAWPT